MTDLITIHEPAHIELASRLRRDINKASATMDDDQARFFVDQYYAIQNYRIVTSNQIRSATTLDPDEEDSEEEEEELLDVHGNPRKKSSKKVIEPHELIAWLSTNMVGLENDIRRILDKYSSSKPAGVWAKDQYGIGPVIAAGLLAHIPIERTPTPSALWRYAGYDPTSIWLSKTRRPWNARLKVLCWKAGQSFMKLNKKDDCFYGKIYVERKLFEQHRNDSGQNKDKAADQLLAKKYGKATVAYKHLSSGKLPPGQIDARARRYAVKIFLAHYWVVLYESTYNKPAPHKCYAIDKMAAHTHYLEIPDWTHPE